MWGRLLLLILVAACYQAWWKIFPDEACALDPQVELILNGRTFSWDSCKVFSTEYEDARQKFRKTARNLKKREGDDVQFASLPIVLDDGTPDSPLTTDIVVLPGTLPGVLVHSSATHGVEGYAGSAIQLALMEEGVLPKERPTIVLIHAINPYGMKNYRRCNEENIDLNRNAFLDFETFLEHRDPNIANYDDFRGVTAPPFRPFTGTVSAFFNFWPLALPPLVTHGYQSLKRVLVSGQYHHPEGIFYGGTKRAKSIEKLKEYVETNREWLFPKNEPSMWIDVHTGLGKFGMDTLDFENNIAASVLQNAFSTAHAVLASDSKNTGALSGYDLTQGGAVSMIYQLSQERAVCVLQEFGTVPGVLVGRALILENMMHHYGTEEDRRVFGRGWLQGAFYPQSTEWRRSILQRGVSVVFEAIEYIQETKTHTSSEDKPDPVEASSEATSTEL